MNDIYTRTLPGAFPYLAYVHKSEAALFVRVLLEEQDELHLPFGSSFAVTTESAVIGDAGADGRTLWVSLASKTMLELKGFTIAWMPAAEVGGRE